MNDLRRPSPRQALSSPSRRGLDGAGDGDEEGFGDDDEDDDFASAFEEGGRLGKRELRIPARVVKAQEGVRRGLDLVRGFVGEVAGAFYPIHFYLLDLKADEL